MNTIKETKERKILVVDDDKVLRKMLNRILTKQELIVFEAADGIEAQDILMSDEIDLVISDIKMPKLHGIELLHYIKKNINIPVILMSGYSDVIDIVEATQIGASDLLCKPFSKNLLLESIDSSIQLMEEIENSSKLETESVSISNKYCKVRIDDLLIGSGLNIPIYIKISEIKFLKLAFQSSDLAADRLNTLKEKGVSDLYISKDDYKKYLDYHLLISNDIFKRDEIKNKTKLKLLKKSNDIIMQFAFELDLNEEIFEIAKEKVMQTLSVACDNRKLLKVLSQISKKKTYDRALIISVISTMIAMDKGWSSKNTVFLVSMAGLFLDIGLRDLSPLLWDHNLSEMDDEGFNIFTQHPLLSSEYLQKNVDLPVELYQIISHHHERCDGSGYPKQLSKNNIHPLAKIVGVVDEYFHLVSQSDIKNDCEKRSSVIEKMRHNIKRYDVENFKSFCKILSKGGVH